MQEASGGKAGELILIQLVVFAFLLQEFFMISGFRHDAVLDDDNHASLSVESLCAMASVVRFLDSFCSAS